MAKSASLGLYTCDLVCLGTASPRLFREYLETLNGGDRKVVGYEHRSKAVPWGATREQAKFSDGSVESGSSRTLAWQRGWSRFMVRPSCYECGYHSTSRPGDLTIGDFWGISQTDNARFADSLGVSCVLANDDRGLEMLHGAAGQLELRASALDDCANDAQPMLTHPPVRSANRDVFMAAVSTSGFAVACRKVGLAGPVRAAKDAIKRMLFGARGATSREAAVGGGCNMHDAEENEGVKKMLTFAHETCEYPLVFAAKNRDDAVRGRSSSGGMFHALASWAIEQCGVVYGCAFDESLRAAHVRCETMAQVECCMGSKYSQSDMKDSIRLVRDDLVAGRLVLFTGTPCQVDAVRRSCTEYAAGGGDIDFD